MLLFEGNGFSSSKTSMICLAFSSRSCYDILASWASTSFIFVSSSCLTNAFIYSSLLSVKKLNEFSS
jgi:hypothetical protein